MQNFVPLQTTNDTMQKGKSFKYISKLPVSLSIELTDDYSDKKKKKSHKCKQCKITFGKSTKIFRTGIVPSH